MRLRGGLVASRAGIVALKSGLQYKAGSVMPEQGYFMLFLVGPNLASATSMGSSSAVPMHWSLQAATPSRVEQCVGTNGSTP